MSGVGMGGQDLVSSHVNQNFVGEMPTQNFQNPWTNSGMLCLTTDHYQKLMHLLNNTQIGGSSGHILANEKGEIAGAIN